ncbi:MAG: nucleotidyl transferase AbiEii/AbiGii toxin family protein [bacterium]|nr:nucleotidyl transferase AbiEii/AbiGii toxin family protein [bacterium]
MFLEAIKSEQKRIFDKLKQLPGFYLAGGTALALQIGHRISVDFDLFSEKNFPPKLLDKVRKIFKEFEIEIVINHSEQLSVKANKVKIDFVKYNFRPIMNLSELKGVKLLSVPEIAAAKAYTIGRRITFKDYVDLYFVLREKLVSLQKIITICEKKYKDEFNERLFLEQLISVEEAEEAPMEFLKKPVSKGEMAEFFKGEIKKLKI